MLSTAIDVVLRGPKVALKAVPRASFGKYFTVDREETERINALRNLIVGYLKNPKDTRPLSVTVFGPPGSGKSFAMKELIQHVVGEKAQALEFNLSQFTPDTGDLHEAFHRVRDASIKNQVPFVFWDEFDSQDLRWLKDFLAPMQDATFRAGGLEHLFGKSVFIFAGGTSESFAKFNKGPRDPDFVAKKGPDFVSRLRGFLNIKGPNPTRFSDGSPAESEYLVRRAGLLRGYLERHAPGLIDRAKQASIDASLVQALLTVHTYEHGARSLEALVTMSDLSALRARDRRRYLLPSCFVCISPPTSR